MFSAILKKLRTEKKITQKKLAEQLFVDCSTVTKWETGKAFPDFKKQQMLAEIFDVSIDYLFGREDKKEKPAENDELENKNVKFIGRDGTVKFKKLSPEMIAMLEQLPDSGDDL